MCASPRVEARCRPGQPQGLHPAWRACGRPCWDWSLRDLQRSCAQHQTALLLPDAAKRKARGRHCCVVCHPPRCLCQPADAGLLAFLSPSCASSLQMPGTAQVSTVGEHLELSRTPMSSFPL